MECCIATHSILPPPTKSKKLLATAVVLRCVCAIVVVLVASRVNVCFHRGELVVRDLADSDIQLGSIRSVYSIIHQVGARSCSCKTAIATLFHAECVPESCAVTLLRLIVGSSVFQIRCRLLS